MKLGIISYSTAHLKTEQVLLNLVDKYDIKLYALPFVPRPSRKVVFQHRPNQFTAVHPQELCGYYGLTYVPVTCDSEIDNDCDLYLVTGAGLLSAECLQGKKVLNGHPGIIPAVRGLDAFKWSIYNLLPLGVTLHYIDEKVDEGNVISVVPTPIFLSDTLETVARRHYENEIMVLSNFENCLLRYQNPFRGIEHRERNRRMTYEQEISLAERFELYKQNYCKGQIKGMCLNGVHTPTECTGGGDVCQLILDFQRCGLTLMAQLEAA